MLFQMKEYKLNLRTKKCNVSNLDRPFRPFEVPPFAKFDFEAEVGPASMPGEHMTIQEWEAEFRTHGKLFIRSEISGYDVRGDHFYNCHFSLCR